MNKKVVVLGGGTGLSTLLRGLKQYPLDITAVVSVCDDGKSTGKLRQEFNIPAVGDIRRVIVSLSETEPLFQELFNYRFSTTSDLNNHTLGNLFLTAMLNVTGSLTEGINALSKVFNLKGRVLPLTEDANTTLMAKMEDGSIVKGEHNITKSEKVINDVFYEKDPIINPKVLDAIEQADLIILSMGSLFTSLIPNLICKEIINKIDSSKAKIMYVCNMFTQPGETDNFSVSHHLRLLNRYLGKHKVDVIIVNNGEIDEALTQKYTTLEQKDKVKIDRENLSKIQVDIIEDNFVTIIDNVIRHDVNRLAFYIFSYFL